MKTFAKAGIASILLLGAAAGGTAQLAEEFDTDPVASGRFAETVFGTESLFLHGASNGALTATLDVDFDPAFYLSSPFAPLTAAGDASFSFQFRITALDTRVPPAAFLGLLTTNHVALGGDGLTVALTSLSNGLPAFSANVDQGPANFGGESVPLALNADYLAVGRYTSSNRQLAVEVYGGAGFVTLVGRSTAQVTNTLGFSLDRAGLQNAGGTAFDYNNGSITVVMDSLHVPARPPVHLAISTNVVVAEGDSGVTNALFTVSLSSPGVQTVRVDYATEAVTAVAGEDYLAQTGTLEFPPGVTNVTIAVPVLGNVAAQTDRTFRVVLTNASGGSIVAGVGIGTILDDDACLVSIGDAAGAEALGAVEMVFTVSLSRSNTQPVSVTFATTNGAATAGLDYVPTNGLLTFAPGVTDIALPVVVLPDLLDEWDEDFTVHLAGPVNAALARATGLGVITNTTPPPVVSVAASTNVIEGNSGGTVVEALLTLSAASGKPVTAGFTTTPGTATAGVDFEAAAGLVTFQPGQTSLLVPFIVMTDLMREGAETFFVDLGYATNAVPGNTRETITILDDDAVPVIDITDVTVREGDAGMTNAVFAVAPSNPSAAPISVAFATTNGTAEAGVDYAATNGVLTWAAGETVAQFIVVPVNSDTLNEANETFAVALTAPVNAALAKSQALGTILNDDFVTVAITGAQVTEGDGGTTNLVFTVSLSGPSAQQVTVRYATADGTAAAGADYVAGGGVLTFTTNTSATIAVPVFGDLMDEPDETLSVVLADLTNASFVNTAGAGLIRDDDPPTLGIASVTLNEGDSNTTAFVFTLALSSPATETVTAAFQTLDGSAVEGNDYTAASGVVEFPPGAVTASLIVLVHGDTLFEPNESFFVQLLGTTNAILSDALAFGTIVNDDTPPFVNVTDVALIEGDCANLTITLSATSSLPVIVRYCVTNLPERVFLVCDTNCASASATNAPPECRSGCCDIVIPPGMLTAQVRLCAEHNGVDEPDILGGGNVVIIAGSGQPGTNAVNQIVIVDIDAPNLLVADAAVLEGDSGTANLCFTVRLSSPRDATITADFLTFDGTATADLDYLTVTGSVVFPPGVRTQFVCVPVAGDLHYEGVETFSLRFQNFVNLSGSNVTARGVILDDDTPPALAVADAAVIEGDDGTNYALFQVSVLSPTAAGIDVLYILFDGTASSLSDYVRDVRWLHFDPGVTNLTVAVPVLGDRRDEPDETFVLQLRNPINATIERSEATGTIIDDDPPELRVGNADVLEGGAGGANVLSFTVTLSSTSAAPLTVEFLTGDGTAIAGVDYVATSGTLTFAPGVTSGVVTVAVIGELLTELNETLSLFLTNAVGGTLAGLTGVGTILDDDAPCLFAAPAWQREAAEGPTNLVFNFTLDHSSTLDIAVSYTISNGTALAGADYIAQSGTLLFPAGTTAQTLAVVINSDLEMEPDETFTVHLFAPVNALLCEAVGVGAILDGTIPPVITVGDAVATEGDAGFTSAFFPVTLSRASPQTVRFDLATADGSARTGLDYFAQTGTVVFLPGLTSNSFVVPVPGDCAYEESEFFLVHLSNPVAAVFATNVVTGTILNDDPLPTVFIEGVTVREGDGGTTNAVFRLRLSCPSSLPIAVPFATRDGTAVAGLDYVETVGAAFFPAGATGAVATVPVLGDLVPEADEFFHLTLAETASAVLFSSEATGLILDDDGVVIGIAPAQGVEGGAAVFHLTLSKPAGGEVTVHFATADGTALENLDYVPTNVVIRFPAGTTNQAQAVTLLTDALEEPDETFLVLLSQPVRASLATNQTHGLIIDDTPPCLTLTDTSITDDGSGDQSVRFPVTLNSPSALTVCVRYHTTNGTAVAGTDYIAADGVLCFAPGETNGEVLVRILPNTREETNEFFYLVLTDPTNAMLCRGIATATIINPLVTNMPPSIALVAPPDCLTLPADLTLTATASDPDGRINRVDFYAGTNLLGARLEPPYAVTWHDVLPGQHLLTAVAFDNVGASATSAPVSLYAAYPASVSIDDTTVVESHTGTNAVFTLTLSSASCRTVSVEVLTFDGTALAGLDYVAVTNSVSFLPGETVKLLSVPVLGDTVLEPDETFLACLTNQQNVTLARACGVGTILDDDTNTFPAIALAAPGDCLLLPANLMVVATASDPDGTVERVEFYDHATLLGACVAAPFEFPWTNVPSGLHLLTAVAVDNLGARSTSAPVSFSASFPATLTIDDVTVFESLTGTNAVFTLALDAPSCRPVSVDVVTRDGTALAGLDYETVRTNLTFLPGETVRLISVPILGDSLLEPDETFFVCLTNHQFATLARPCGLGTILNDDTNVFPSIALASPGDCLLLPTNLTLTATASDSDGLVDRVEFYDHDNMIGSSAVAPFVLIWTNVPSGQHLLSAIAVDNLGARATSAPVSFTASLPASLTIDDVTVFESLTGTNAVFTLSLAAPSCRAVSVDVATADGTALADYDYRPVWTNVTFLPGETARTVSVPILGDSLLEPDEAFFLCLTNEQYATLARACGVGTILNDDSNVFPSIALAAPCDCLLLPTNLPLVATATDADGVIEGVEFYNHTTLLGVRTEAPFELLWTNVPSGQHLLTAVAVDNLGARATSAPVAFLASFPASLSIDDVTVHESLAGTNAVFTLSLDSPSCRTVTVEVVTRDGTALAGSDYVAAQANLVFAPGETVKTLSVTVLGDSLLEPDEVFFLCLTNEQYVTLVRTCGVGTILNDDTNVFPSIALAAPGDCLLLPTNLTLVATVADADGTVDRVEYFDYDVMIGKRLGPPFEFVWSKVTAGQHLLTAVAVDNLGATATSAPVAFSASFPASLTIDDVTVHESLTGTNAVFTLALASPSCRTVSVEVVTRDGTALAGLDYAAVRTNFIFLPGETVKTLSVIVLGDSVIEPDETFFVCLTNQHHATLARECGLGTILNDDTVPPANLPPTVAIITPTNGQVFVTPPGLVPIEAVAQDSDGVVTRVDFYSGPLFLGTDTNAPFAVLWTNNVIGDYTLTAVATDDDDAKGTSAPVNITIRGCVGDIAATPLQDQLRCVCDEVIFSTAVTSPEPVTYAWYWNGILLPGETNPSLHLQGLKPESAGLYTVVVTSPCTNTSRSATLTIRGAGNLNPVSFTNDTRVIITDNTVASPYPSPLEVFCVPGPLKHIAVTLDGLSHNFPDDVDILLVSPDGQSVKLMSDCGGTGANKLTNVVLTFTDTATTPLPDTTRIAPGIYAPTDFAPAETFPAPAPTTAPTNTLAPLLGINPNGLWSLFIRDDQGGDAGQLLRGWQIAIEWQDTVPFLTAPHARPDGSFELTLLGLPRMTHVIEASSDLQNWTPVSTNTPSSNATLFIDPHAGSSPSRFYRAVRCP